MSIYTVLIIVILVTVMSFALGWYLRLLKSKGNIAQLQERVHQLQIQNDEVKQQRQEQALAEQKQHNSLVTELKEIRREKEFLNTELARRNTSFENLQAQLVSQKKEVHQLQEKFGLEFENLANKILEEKSNKFTKQNSDNLKLILHPLQEKIKTFEQKVEQTHKESIDHHAALRQQIFGLKEVNLQMSKETINLTKALKGDSKTQGNWGELVLERVLQKSGLEKNREYFAQKSFKTESGHTVLPDVIIYLPDNKKMIVDSKVSLTAYEKYHNEDEIPKKQEYLKQHLLSIKTHIKQLSEKRYQDLYDIASPDFVLMFIPIEPAFALAVNQDNHLYNTAFEKNIIIVTPTTLLATLRTIDTMWNNEKQQRNALEIAKQAGTLYDKFEGLIKDLTNIGKKMDSAKLDYTQAMNKLVDGKGNLITSVEKLKKMGAKAKKSIPETLVEKATENNESDKTIEE